MAEKPTTSEHPEYLVCEALCGFNDQLTRISFCFDYCLRTGAKLLIETRNGGLGVPFDEVFDVDESCPVFVDGFSRDWVTALATKTQFPRQCLDKVGIPREEIYHGEGRSHYQKVTDIVHGAIKGSALKLDGQVLIYSSGGGGDIPLKTLGYFRLKPSIADAVIDRVTKLPANYAAIHLRYTDMKVDAQTAFNLCAKLFDGRDLLVCSDNQRVKGMANRIVGESARLHFLNDLPAVGSKGLHNHENGYRGTSKFIIDLMTDLFAMALAKDLIAPQVVPFREVHKISGFVRLAMRLRNNRETVLKVLSSASPDKRAVLDKWLGAIEAPSDQIAEVFEAFYNQQARERLSVKAGNALRTTVKLGNRYYSAATFLRRVSFGRIKL